jgi:hypothetical protein
MHPPKNLPVCAKIDRIVVLTHDDVPKVEADSSLFSVKNERSVPPNRQSHMAERYINQFRERYIAIYRPNKRTYTILEWVHAGNYWKRHLTDPDSLNAIVIGSSELRPAPTKINTIRSTVIQENRLVKCMASGEYLIYQGRDVAIVQKTSDSTANFRPSIFAGEFPAANIPIGPVVTIPPLWTLRDPPAAAAPTIATIPMRIAWIIAEDSSKKGEKCAITLDEISPITASVTSCYHVFTTTALETWFQSKSICPVCKQKATYTAAYAASTDLIES